MHYQKVPKMPESIPYLSVGFDIGTNFTWMSIMLPNGILIGESFKIIHSDPQSYGLVISKIKEAQEVYSPKGRCFFKSTGIYHIPLLCLLHDKGLDCAVINPIITDGSADMSVRRLRNDRFDSKKAAKVGLDASLKAPIVPDDAIIGLRNLVCDYYYFKDLQSAIVLKLRAGLKVSFPVYLSVFSKVTTQASLRLLGAYSLATDMSAAPKGKLVGTIRSTTRFEETYALTKYDAICTVARDAAVFRRALPSNALRIRLYIKMYREYRAHLDSILEELHQIVGKLKGTPDYDRISFIQTLHGVSFLNAAVLIARMGPFDLFSSPKKLYAYLGLDPGVNDSGKFHEDRVRISRWGSSLARHILHMATTNNLKVDKATKTPVNPVICDYYTRKYTSKKKSVAVGTAMHKVCNVISTMLQDNKPSELIMSEERRERYIAEHPESVSTAARWKFGLDFRIPWQ